MTRPAYNKKLKQFIVTRNPVRSRNQNQFKRANENVGCSAENLFVDLRSRTRCKDLHSGTQKVNEVMTRRGILSKEHLVNSTSCLLYCSLVLSLPISISACVHYRNMVNLTAEQRDYEKGLATPLRRSASP